MQLLHPDSNRDTGNRLPASRIARRTEGSGSCPPDFDWQEIEGDITGEIDLRDDEPVTWEERWWITMGEAT